jgi:small subunit ribosomal protein S1
MEQPELSNEEERQHESSSAELSESETAPDSSEPTEVVEDAGEALTEVDHTDDESDVSEPVADGDVTTDDSADETDDTDETDDSTGSTEEDKPNGLSRGDVIVGTVARTTPNEIFVDLGNDIEGLVPKREVELMSRNVLEQLDEGSEIHVYIVNPRNHRGQTILSINHAQEELDWREAEGYLENKEVYDGRIGGYNKGGLIVRFGRLRGFVPQSQISDTRMLDISGETPEEKYSDLVNSQISVKVMEVDRSRNRLILSERAAMREVRQRRKEALITELEVGEIRDGRVVSLENFGAFVDIGGAEGLVHITELSWEHVTHPRQVLDVGQEVDVKVISVDADANRIGLSIKQLKPDPWDELAARFGKGALIRATVTKLTKFGAFAKVEQLPAVEGLIHISELSNSRVEHPRDVVNRGDKLTLRVVKVDVKNRRLGLSLRQVNSSEWLDKDLARAYREAEERADDDEDDIPSASELGDADDGEDDNVPPETPEAVAADADDTDDDEGVIEEVSDAVEEAVETVDDATDQVEDAIEEAVDQAEDAVEDVAESVEDAVEEAVDNVSEAVSDAVETVSGGDDDDDDSGDDDDDDKSE